MQQQFGETAMNIAITFDARRTERVAIQARADVLTAERIESIASRYNRARDLPELAPRLVGKSTAEIVFGLENMLASQIKASQTGHWCFGGATRMIEIRAALLAEGRS